MKSPVIISKAVFVPTIKIVLVLSARFNYLCPFLRRISFLFCEFMQANTKNEGKGGRRSSKDGWLFVAIWRGD